MSPQANVPVKTGTALEATIGLEIHAELKTTTKMFCRSLNDSSETEPNKNICPVCLAHPGALPVINKQAVHHVLRVGKALGATLADYTEFDRKNYFYPDLPKGYQISQYEYPLVSGGSLKGIEITRVHLEEDTASSIHDEATGATLIDYNRGGVPLMELVTEPVIKSAEQAGEFARELQLLFRYLGVSDANMEKGEMRVEANISVAEPGKRGTKVEVKNLNSFRMMERAIAYELKRQAEVIAEGGEVQQETRGWNDVKQQTFVQRIKETSADYRYFPDPDLPSLKISEIPEFEDAALLKTLPELPEERRARYRTLNLKPVVIEQFVTYPHYGSYFDSVVEGETDPTSIERAANYIANDLVNLNRDTEKPDTQYQHEMPISVERFKIIMNLVGKNKVSSRVAKDLLVLTVAEDRDPEVIAKEKGLFQDATLDLSPVIAKILNDNLQVVLDYKGGKVAALQFLLGQGMKELKGAVDPAILRAKFIEALS